MNNQVYHSRFEKVQTTEGINENTLICEVHDSMAEECIGHVRVEIVQNGVTDISIGLPKTAAIAFFENCIRMLQ